MYKFLLTGIILFFCIIAPNLFWLSWSTARISNDSGITLESVTVSVSDTLIYTGDMPQGKTVFTVIPVNGEGSFKVRYLTESKVEKTCRAYVENGMYHVEVFISDRGELNCNSSLPLLSELLILKLM